MVTGETPQLLRALSAFPQELGFISSTYMAVHNHLKLHFQGTRHPLLVPSSTRCALSTQTYIQANCARTLKINKRESSLREEKFDLVHVFRAFHSAAAWLVLCMWSGYDGEENVWQTTAVRGREGSRHQGPDSTFEGQLLSTSFF